MSEDTGEYSSQAMYDSVPELFAAYRRRKKPKPKGKAGREGSIDWVDPESAAKWPEKKKEAYLKEIEKNLKESGIDLEGIHRDGLHGLEAAMAVTRRMLYPEKDIATGVPKLGTSSKSLGRKRR